MICISIHAPAKGATSDASSGSIGRSYFNPRSREGSDQAAAKESRGGGNFNPRSREGSDVGRCNLERLTAISIHAPAKGATYFDYLKVSVRIFQSTLPRRERRASYETRTSGRCYFNPRSREGSDSSANSIINRQTLFQSTLPRRERHPAPLPSHPLQHFNPRSREGSDGLLLHSARTEQDFNPRSREGSDRLLGRGLRCGLSFQSTLPRRERQYNRIEAVTGFPFQSTLPRRERPCAATVPTSTPFNFNPRSREGSDTRYCMLVDNTVISIHAPAKGATMIGGESDSGTGISIHAPAKGATCGPRKWSAMRWYFNPRSREGSDTILKQAAVRPPRFQSTLPRRERRRHTSPQRR